MLRGARRTRRDGLEHPCFERCRGLAIVVSAGSLALRHEYPQFACKKSPAFVTNQTGKDEFLGIANHERQFRQLLGEHQGLLIKVVRSFADYRADQDDLFQEIVLQVWLSLPSFRKEAKPTTWLYRVALNTALAWKRGETKRRGRQSPLSLAHPTAQAAMPADEARDGDLVEQLYTAIRALPLVKRALVVLYLDGFTYREIAEVVGVSESNVGVSLNRIKRELAAAIKEPGDGS